MKGKSGQQPAGTGTAQHKHNRSETINKQMSYQHHLQMQQQINSETVPVRSKNSKTVQMNSKLRQHSNNNSVSIRKPMNENIDLSLEGLPAPPNIMNNSIDHLNNNMLAQPQIVQIANEISRSQNTFQQEEMLDYNNEQDLFFLEQHIQMNQEELKSVKDEDELMEDEDDQQGILNYLSKLDLATKFNDHGKQPKDNNKGSTSRNETKAMINNSQSGQLSNRLIQLENSVDETKIRVPIKGQVHKKIINMGDRLIGDYKVEKTLGQGTFGKVKQGYHIFTGQKVAIKILDKWKIDDVNDIERVAREIHILRIVRHSTIIQLYEIIETKNRLFLIMEHCCNGELFNYITSKNHLKEDEACRLFQQLISGIEYLGELGIAHRDIKPENLLLDQQKNLKIVDFGLSNTFKPNEKLVTACGSPCYAAPELIKGLEYIGPKADIWSAGVVLYCLVCGHLPFEDQNTQSLYQKILSANYQFTCHLSQEVRNLIENILVPEPALRYGLKQIKQNAWFNLYKGESLKQSQQETSVFQNIKVHKKLIREMKKQCSHLDLVYARCCIAANQKNNVTAHYNLLLKKKNLLGESISDFSQAGNHLLDGLDDLGKLTKRNNENIFNEKPIPGGRQVRDFHSIPAAPRHNIANLDRLSRQRYPQYGYQMKKMQEGLIDLKNQKNEQVFMNIDGNQMDSASRLQWDFPDKDVAKASNMNYQAQRKNNAQIKKIVDRNHAPTNTQQSSTQPKHKSNQLKQKNQMEAQKSLRQQANNNSGSGQNKRIATSGSIIQSLENQALSNLQPPSHFNQQMMKDSKDPTAGFLNLDDYKIQQQISMNQGSLLTNYDQLSNSKMPVNREFLQKTNSSIKHSLNTNSKLSSANRNHLVAAHPSPGKSSKQKITNSHQRQNKQQRMSENKRAAFDNSARNISKLSVNSGNKHRRGDSSFLRLQKGINNSISQANEVANATQTIVANAGSKFSSLNKKSQLSNRDGFIKPKMYHNNSIQANNNQSGQFIKQLGNKNSVNRINSKNSTMNKPMKQNQREISTMVTNLALNQNYISQKSQRGALHPSTGKNSNNNTVINKSNSISKKTKLKSSLVDFTRNISSNNPGGQRATQNQRAQMYNTASSIDHTLGQEESLSNPINIINATGKRNDTMRNDAMQSLQHNSQIVHASQGVVSSLTNSATQKISRKHIRANTSINNYNTTMLNGLSQLNQQQQMLLNSYGPQQKNSMVTSAVGAVSAVKQPNVQQSSNLNTTEAGSSNFQNANGMNIQTAMNSDLKDKLNITNSLIISNSQILFQDIGNGKIIPIPFSQAMGTIQPPGNSDQNQIEHHLSPPSAGHQGQGTGASQHQPSQSMQVHHDRRVSQNIGGSVQSNYRTSNSQDKQITSIRGQQNNTITHAQHLQNGIGTVGVSNRREVINSRQQRRKTAQSTRFNTLMQDYSGVGLRDRNNDLQQSYGKTITTNAIAFEGNNAVQQSLDYNNPMLSGFKDNSKSSLQNTLTQGSHGMGPQKTSSQGPQNPGRSTNLRNQYRMVSMSLGNNTKNQVSSQNYRANHAMSSLNQTQGQRVISSITGTGQPTSNISNKIPTFQHKGQGQKGKHGFSKSITDSAGVNKNLNASVGLSQNITRQNNKLSEQYRSHQNRESHEFFNSKERFGGTGMQMTAKLAQANQRQSRQTQRVPVLSQQAQHNNTQKQHQSIGPPVQNQKMKNGRNMSNQSHQHNTNSQFGASGGYQSNKGGSQKPGNKSLSMNQTQNMQPISSVVKSQKQQNQTQNLENQLTNLLEKQQDPQLLNKKNIEQNIQQINNKIYQIKVVGGTPQMLTNPDKIPPDGQNFNSRPIHHTTSNQSKQYLSSIDRAQQKQQNVGMSGGSLNAFYTSTGSGGGKYHKAGTVAHQSIENGKIPVQRNNIHGSQLVDKSRDFDNMQTILHDQQRKLIRDNYLQGFQGNQPLGFNTSLENSRSAANYQNLGSAHAPGPFNQSLAFPQSTVNGSMGTIQNNQDMKRNLRMIKMTKQGTTQSSLNQQQ